MDIEGKFEVTLWRQQWRHHSVKYFFCHDLGRSGHIWRQVEFVFNNLTFFKWLSIWGCDNFFNSAGSLIYQQNSHENFRNLWYFMDAIISIYIISKFWYILRPYDIISTAMNTNLCKCSHNPTIHPHSKYSDAIFVRFWGHSLTSSKIVHWSNWRCVWYLNTLKIPSILRLNCLNCTHKLHFGCNCHFIT